MRSTVRKYIDHLAFGFIVNPEAGKPDIYVDGRNVPMRQGVGQRLIKNETVDFETVQRGRHISAVNISFPPPAPTQH